MDQRSPCEQPVRHDAVHRAPIVAEHQIVPAGRDGLAERLELHGPQRPGKRGKVFEHAQAYVARDLFGRAHRAGNGTHEIVLEIRAERVHQPNRARFLAAEVKGRVEMQDTGNGGRRERHARPISRPIAATKSSRQV